MGLLLVSPVSFPLLVTLEILGSQIQKNSQVVYCRKLDVINRGLSGFNTEWAIPVFEQVSRADLFDQVSKVTN